MSSPSPLVHGFPHPNDDLWAAQASGQVLKLFVDHRKRWVLYRIPSLLFLLPVVRVLSSALLSLTALKEPAMIGVKEPLKG